MFSLDDLLYRTGAKLRYVYDPVEARWTHDLVVESTRYLNSNWSGPVYCLEGIRACPPESCDGPAGFTELLKGLKNPRHPDHAEWDRRFGSVDFDAFEIDRVNKALKARRSSGEKDPAVILEGPTPKTPLDPLYRLGLALKNKAAS